MGAGCSGSPPPGRGCWSQCTTVPSAYVWVAGKLTVGLLGSWTRTAKRPNWSAPIPLFGAADQVTDRTVPAALSRSSLAVQPGIAAVDTEVRLGSATLSSVVGDPASDSLGTRNVIIALSPCTGSSASTWTWADAGALPTTAPRAREAAAAAVMRAREMKLLSDTEWTSLYRRGIEVSWLSVRRGPGDLGAISTRR